VIPTIGTLFALNFVSALVVALGLVVPLQRLSPVWGRALLALLAAGGAGIALGLVRRLESETTGCSASWSRATEEPSCSIALDAAALIFLSTFLGAGWRSRPPGARRPARAQGSR
jgi:hypothetical protein